MHALRTPHCMHGRQPEAPGSSTLTPGAHTASCSVTDVLPALFVAITTYAATVASGAPTAPLPVGVPEMTPLP